MNVVGFLQAVGCDFSSADAVGASVGQENGVVVLHQPVAVPVHAETIVTHAMKQDHSVPIRSCRPNEPGTQGRAIGGCNLDTAKFCVFRLSLSCGFLLIVSRQRTPTRMQRNPPQTDAVKDCADDV